MDKREVYSTDGPTCPYCGYVNSPSDDPECYDESVTDWTCYHCDRDYRLSVYVRHSWTSTPIADAP